MYSFSRIPRKFKVLPVIASITLYSALFPFRKMQIFAKVFGLVIINISLLNIILKWIINSVSLEHRRLRNSLFLDLIIIITLILFKLFIYLIGSIQSSISPSRLIIQISRAIPWFSNFFFSFHKLKSIAYRFAQINSSHNKIWVLALLVWLQFVIILINPHFLYLPYGHIIYNSLANP